MKIGKLALTGKVWKRVELTEEETNEAMSQLLKFNIKELKRVIEEVRKANLVINPEQAIQMLFEKQGMASYTFLNNILEEKIQLSKMKEIEKEREKSPFFSTQ